MGWKFWDGADGMACGVEPAFAWSLVTLVRDVLDGDCERKVERSKEPGGNREKGKHLIDAGKELEGP